MAKELPSGTTAVTDSPITLRNVEVEIPSPAPAMSVRVIEAEDHRGRMPTRRETADLMAELGHHANAQQRAAAQLAAEAKRAEAIATLAPKAAAVDFIPQRFEDADMKVFAKLVAATSKAGQGIDTKMAEARVLEELRSAHEAKLLDAARQFKSPIRDEAGMAPGERSIVESAAAAAPVRRATPKGAGNLGVDQGKGRDAVGKWTEQHAQKPEGLSGLGRK